MMSVKKKFDGTRFSLFIVGLSLFFVVTGIGLLTSGVEITNNVLIGVGIVLIVLPVIIAIVFLACVGYHHHLKKSFRLIFCSEDPENSKVLVENQVVPVDLSHCRGKKLKEKIDTSEIKYLNIELLIEKTWKDQNTGAGRDARGLGHIGLQVTDITEITNLSLEEEYETYKAKLTSQSHKINSLSSINEGPIITTEVNIQGHKCNAGVNEVFLFHGTKQTFVDSIVQNGFKASTGGLFGPGVYLAESAQKADQYTDSSSNRQASGLKMLIVKALLGRVVKPNQEDGDEHVIGGCFCPCSITTYCRDKNDTLVIHSNKIGNTPRFREFVMKNPAYCLPKFVVTYDRI